jgi:hypothetical protein
MPPEGSATAKCGGGDGRAGAVVVLGAAEAEALLVGGPALP